MLVQRDRDRVCIPEYHSVPAYTRSSGRDAEDGASEEQGLLLLIKMDVVELVPSGSFSPRTNVDGWMSDRTSKVRM